MRPATAGALWTLGAVLGGTGGALAQDGTRIITGTVVDSANNKPVSQAVIYLDRIATGQRTAKDGAFRVLATEVPQLLMVRRPGYVPALVVVPGGTAGAETDLGTTRIRQLKTDADREAAREADVRAYPELGRFYDHRTRYAQGVFLTPDDLQRIGGALVTIIRQKPNFHFICFVTRKGDWDCGQEASRGPTSITRPGWVRSAEQEPCLLEIWTNGAQPFHRTLDDILAEDVLAAEAYSNPGATPAEYKGSPCATLVLYMGQRAP